VETPTKFRVDPEIRYTQRQMHPDMTGPVKVIAVSVCRPARGQPIDYVDGDSDIYEVREFRTQSYAESRRQGVVIDREAEIRAQLVAIDGEANVIVAVKDKPIACRHGGGLGGHVLLSSVTI